MFRPGGVMITSDGDMMWRNDTINCCHCQKVMERKQRPAVKGIVGRDDPDDIGGICGGCGKPICWQCAGALECTPIDMRLDQYERTRDARWLQSGVRLRGR